MKRVNLFLGHYGTGKTNIALNFALMLKKDVIVYDLDIVNPYFRTLDGKDILDENNIPLIASDYANTNVDCPAMNPECYLMVRDKDKYAVVDVGGDDRGAYALGRFRNEILKENNYDMFLIINKYRYETRTPEETLEIKKEIEDVAGIKFTAIINNSNLGRETTKETILDSISYANEVSKLTGLEVKYTAIREDLVSEFKGEIDNIIPLKLINYGLWV
jgi:MinD-like ATPase involved in chromosome partitioning or flagellar assembly